MTLNPKYSHCVKLDPKKLKDLKELLYHITPSKMRYFNDVIAEQEHTNGQADVSASEDPDDPDEDDHLLHCDQTSLNPPPLHSSSYANVQILYCICDC